jgi:hypothetical protein
MDYCRTGLAHSGGHGPRVGVEQSVIENGFDRLEGRLREGVADELNFHEPAYILASYLQMSGGRIVHRRYANSCNLHDD